MNTLEGFGWTGTRQQQWDELALVGVRPARVVADFGTSLKLSTPEIITAELSGKLAHYTERDRTPKVGDWVAVAISENGNAVVESVVLRTNEIARKVTGRRTQKQIIATNVDIAFVLVALDADFSVERLRRFLYQLSVSSVEAVIVLNKADIVGDIQPYLDQLQEFAVPIVIASAATGDGVDEIASRILPGKTVILLGSSGVGKSTLTNALLGRDIQTTNTLRASDGTGRHTTVHRELFILPNGGILIDTPGIRELQLWGTEGDLDETYDDITAIAAQCRYSNCRHGSESGCAVQAALRGGTLERKHYGNYLKMKQELATLSKQRVEKLRQTKRHISRQKKRVSFRDDASVDDGWLNED